LTTLVITQYVCGLIFLFALPKKIIIGQEQQELNDVPHLLSQGVCIIGTVTQEGSR